MADRGLAPAPRAGTVAVIGAGGRIGGLLAGLHGGPLRPVGLRRGQDPLGLDQPGPALPIVACVRNDDLPAALAGLHPSRHADVVFVQNGALRPFLADRGLQGATRGALYVAVERPGGPPVPGGVSVFSGPWAAPIAAWLQRGGVAAAAVGPAVLAREEAVKLAWIVSIGAIGEARAATVGEVLDREGPALEALVRELHPLLQAALQLDLAADRLVERVFAYSLRVAHWPARAKEPAWRQGWVEAEAARQGRALPELARWSPAPPPAPTRAAARRRRSGSSE